MREVNRDWIDPRYLSIGSGLSYDLGSALKEAHIIISKIPLPSGYKVHISGYKVHIWGFDNRSALLRLSVGRNDVNPAAEINHVHSSTEMTFHLSELPIIMKHLPGLNFREMVPWDETGLRIAHCEKLLRMSFPVIWWPEEWTMNEGWTACAVLVFAALERTNGLEPFRAGNAPIMSDPDRFNESVIHRLGKIIRSCPPLNHWTDAEVVEALLIGQFDLTSFIKLAE